MTAEENKALVRNFYEEVMNKGNLNVIDKMTATNFVDHNPPPGLPPGIEGVKAGFVMMRKAFPDGRMTVDDIVSEGDKVVVRGTWRGTHKAEFMGIPATGKKVTIEGIDVMRLQGGKATEHWGQWDTMGMMTQLGVVSPPGQPSKK